MEPDEIIYACVSLRHRLLLQDGRTAYAVAGIYHHDKLQRMVTVTNPDAPTLGVYLPEEMVGMVEVMHSWPPGAMYEGNGPGAMREYQQPELGKGVLVPGVY